MPEDSLVRQLHRLVDTMRDEAKLSLETFIISGAKELGGTLVIQAPCSATKRPRYEAGFRSERYTGIIDS